MLAARVRKELAPGARIRVLVVDGSVVVRRLLTRALGNDPLIEVVGAAASGSLALERIPQVNPDVVTLDLQVPGPGGMETLRAIRNRYPELRVVVFSAGVERGAEATFQALAEGVDDYAARRPNQGTPEEVIAKWRHDLAPKIKQFFRAGPVSPRPGSRLVTQDGIAGDRGVHSQILVMGVSTGGPAALAQILPCFPSEFPLPVLIVQHMPAQFTRLLAERLSGLCPLHVREAAEGDAVEPGNVLLAPGDFHMSVRKSNDRTAVHLDQAPPENSCRPSVDVLFRSVAEVYGGAVLAAVLTGMGHDGLRGATALKAVGAAVLAQDEATSVVWGMPGAVTAAGLADAVLPLDAIVPEIVRRIRRD